MSHGTKAQRNRKNKNHPKAWEQGYVYSIQKKSYTPKVDSNQSKLF